MPVIVVGADTETGASIIDALLPRRGEVRAFVSDIPVGLALKERSVKVAIGDISDGSHVGGAALNAFCAVVVAEAAIDDRERSFAADAEAVVAAWVEGLADAKVPRIIVIEYPGVPSASLATVATEYAVIDGTQAPADVAHQTQQLEAAASI
jgi:putative NADH-flavin reductase